MIHVLLIENDPQWADRIRALLNVGAVYEVEWVHGAAEGIERLGQGGVDAVLLDLSGVGIADKEQFDQVALAADRVPIIVLTDAAGEDFVVQAMQDGSHDYLLRSHVDARWLPRALRRVIAGIDLAH